VGVERLDAEQVRLEALRTLGLEGAAPTAPEVLATSLRRAASFLCPTTPRSLIRAVINVLSGLPGINGDSELECEMVLDALVASGDVFELPLDRDGRSYRRLFLGPPAYVRQPSALLVLGVRPDGAALVGEELGERIAYDRHLRVIESADVDADATALGEEGLFELRIEQWLKLPRQVAAPEVVEGYELRLEAERDSGDIEGVRLIDPDANVAYYRGRWRPPNKADEGRFVARRPQAFGAELWCFAAIANGKVVRLIDLPVVDTLAPAADEALRLQAALDSCSGHPQRIRFTPAAEQGSAVVDLFSPVPSWAQRSLERMGTPVERSRGALFSFFMATTEAEEQISLLENLLWLSVDDSPGGNDHAA
jgi:hypothetical protein